VQHGTSALSCLPQNDLAVVTPLRFKLINGLKIKRYLHNINKFLKLIDYTTMNEELAERQTLMRLQIIQATILSPPLPRLISPGSSAFSFLRRRISSSVGGTFGGLGAALLSAAAPEEEEELLLLDPKVTSVSTDLSSSSMSSRRELLVVSMSLYKVEIVELLINCHFTDRKQQQQTKLFLNECLPL
jgi:hypothetical protein